MLATFQLELMLLMELTQFQVNHILLLWYPRLPFQLNILVHLFALGCVQYTSYLLVIGQYFKIFHVKLYPFILLIVLVCYKLKFDYSYLDNSFNLD